MIMATTHSDQFDNYLGLHSEKNIYVIMLITWVAFDSKQTKTTSSWKNEHEH